MTPHQQAYINGFVKRANAYGFSRNEAFTLLKRAEELKGDQHKLDVDNDGKIEGSDLKKLRQRKQANDLANVHPAAIEPATGNAKIINAAGSLYNKAKSGLMGATSGLGNLMNPQGQTIDSKILGGLNPVLNTPAAPKNWQPQSRPGKIGAP